MKANVIVELTQIDQLELIQKQVFNVLDISESTRVAYSFIYTRNNRLL
ncbi:hypothetical protein SAMN05216365_11034 [Porphyromonadaceae bacterium NLAE-zl-C104]|nr:hypothetical protein SAMN05216331_13729 [Porphyromonadaceae bacterium KH3R12]SFS52472.1 hypothetical protein SAMN05216365_11034 [Porphyromonadaceae bacterium NLAE-zl-C104]